MKRYLGILLLCTLPVCGNAQLDLNALKRQSDAKAQERKKESSEFQSNRNARWNEFLDTRSEEWAKIISNRDMEWSDLLSDSEWTVFDGFLTTKMPEKPKPVVVPRVETEPVSKPKPQPMVVPEPEVPKVPQVEPKPEPKPEIKPEPKPQPKPEETQKPAPLPCKPAEDMPEGSTARFNFYGRDIAISYDPALKSYSSNRFKQKEISDFWKTISATNYTPTVTALVDEKERIGLNDWGYYLMVSNFAERLYRDMNCSSLLTWFLLVRSGLDVRVGYNDAGVLLLLPSTTTLFDMSYVVMDNTRYYVINKGNGSGVRTCPSSYADGRKLDFNQSRPLQLGGNNTVRSLSFEYRGKEYRMDFNYDADLTEYYKALPMAQFEVFFSAAPSVQLQQSIVSNLKPIVQTMDKPTGLNFLLRFVQLAFPYKTDPQQFGREKYFYADEVFHYPYCDCEDRSVLFSYLAHELMGYDVVGTEYPEHMATAVAVDYPVEGTKYTVGTRTYTVADPTYIRSSVGQCMSKYENTAPVIHKIDYSK